jgi:glycosyltransferase involved in cell wall biosynthesis
LICLDTPSSVIDSSSKVNISSKKVAILLATFQGQKYLSAQLDSFLEQTYPNWELWVSDDRSSDDTIKILDSYTEKFPINKLNIGSGPARGFVENFLSLTCSTSICAEYYAYSDQDDIWLANKLETAVQSLNSLPQNIPALYCSRTCLVDKFDNEIGYSPIFNKPPSFANALIQNIGGGNTMVFNHAARDLLHQTIDFSPGISHDWWAYILVSGCGGNVIYDTTPTVRYRQHDSNLVGMNSSWSARFKRIVMLFQGRFKRWNDRNIAALQTIQHLLTPDNQKLLNQFANVRQQPLFKRLWQMKRIGIYRQTLFGNLGLVVAAMFGKI